MCNSLLPVPRSKATYSTGALKCAIWAMSFRLTPMRIAAIQLVVHCLVMKQSTHCTWAEEERN